MTRCMRKKVNLKSSAYNQTGQNYYEQLEAYNSMSAHLRRILLAKSVVDTKNKNYLKRNQQCKVQRADSGICLHLEATDDVIDRLAYDTEHHPMDILRIDLNTKHLDSCNYNLDHRLRACSSQMCYEETDQMNRRQRSTSRNQRMMSPTTARSSKRKKFSVPNFVSKKDIKSRDIPHIVEPSTCFSQHGKYKYEKEFLVPCTTTRLDSPMFKLRSPRQKMTSMCSSVSQCYDFDYGEKSEEFVCKRFVSQKEEEKKYVKFVYDITKEIMQRGLYTDKELHDVFKKHINQYKGILNMNKMLYEIYQLKISLNVEDDSDTDEEVDDLIHAQKLLTMSEIRPPTPPKILDENKVIEKLESYQKMMKTERSPKIAEKSVLLVDANPDILVTERDVLISLVEAGVDLIQVQQICKTLRCKSRDLVEAVQVDTTTLGSPDLKVDHLELEHDKQINDKQISAEIERKAVYISHVVDDSVESPEKLEASSSTSNLISTQDEAVEPKEKTEFEITFEHDKVEPEVISEYDKTEITSENDEAEITSENDKIVSEITSEHDVAEIISENDDVESEITSEYDKKVEPEVTSENNKTESEVISEHDKKVES